MPPSTLLTIHYSRDFLRCVGYSGLFVLNNNLHTAYLILILPNLSVNISAQKDRARELREKHTKNPGLKPGAAKKLVFLILPMEFLKLCYLGGSLRTRGECGYFFVGCLHLSQRARCFGLCPGSH